MILKAIWRTMRCVFTHGRYTESKATADFVRHRCRKCGSHYDEPIFHGAYRHD